MPSETSREMLEISLVLRGLRIMVSLLFGISECSIEDAFQNRKISMMKIGPKRKTRSRDLFNYFKVFVFTIMCLRVKSLLETAMAFLIRLVIHLVNQKSAKLHPPKILTLFVVSLRFLSHSKLKSTLNINLSFPKNSRSRNRRHSSLSLKKRRNKESKVQRMFQILPILKLSVPTSPAKVSSPTTDMHSWIASSRDEILLNIRSTSNC